MKKFITLLVWFIVINVYGQRPTINLIPQPVLMQQKNGNYFLTKESTIGFDGEECRKIAEMLAQKLNTATGFAIKVRQGKSGSIQLTLHQEVEKQIGDEGYNLIITPEGVTISANKPAGIFYGVQTFLQLLPPEIESKTVLKSSWPVPSVEIADYPRFGWRGIMLDVSRHFFTKEDVKKYIDEISRFKFNTFHWHLTDDHGWRIEIKSLPKLTEVGAWRVPRAGRFGERAEPRSGEAATEGGFYTHADIKEIVQYAQDRYIRIIPEIDVPGHSMAAIAAYPELSCTKNPNAKVNPGTEFSEWYGNGTFKMFIDNTLNPSDEKVYEFLDKVFTEVADLFPADYIHVGGDESYKGYWAEDEGCRALMKQLNTRHLEDLQGYFMNRVDSILKTKGKKLLGWDEILEGGISADATVMNWRDMKHGIEAVHLGHDVVMVPTAFAYLDYQQGEPSIEPPVYAGLRLKKCYSFEPVPEGVDTRKILGGQGNLWTEQIPNLRHAEYMTWPRGWALSEVYWSPKESKNWNGFMLRVEKHFLRSDFAGINYSKAVYDPIINVRSLGEKMIVDMENEMPDLDIFYTINDAMPDQYSPQYTKPLNIPEGPVTLRVITYRNGKPIGHLITLKPEDLKRRSN